MHVRIIHVRARKRIRDKCIHRFVANSIQKKEDLERRIQVDVSALKNLMHMLLWPQMKRKAETMPDQMVQNFHLL